MEFEIATHFCRGEPAQSVIGIELPSNIDVQAAPLEASCVGCKLASLKYFGLIDSKASGQIEGAKICKIRSGALRIKRNRKRGY